MGRGVGELYEAARQRAEPRAVELFEDALVWDMAMPFSQHYADYDGTLPRFQAAGVDVISLTVQNMPAAPTGWRCARAWPRSMPPRLWGAWRC